MTPHHAEFAPPDYVERYEVGYAQHLRDALPNATFVAFTGTPVASCDRDTRAVFGDYIHVYDMQQAKEDGATVKNGPMVVRQLAEMPPPIQPSAYASERWQCGEDFGQTYFMNRPRADVRSERQKKMSVSRLAQ